MKIPPRQGALIRVISHQFYVYQRAVEALCAVRKQGEISQQLRCQVWLAQYYLDVILGFVGEAKNDTSSSKASWRSAYIDFHFAMGFMGNAYTAAQQEKALGNISRTWNDFQRKKHYPPVDKCMHNTPRSPYIWWLTEVPGDAMALHREFCIGKENMCGNMGGGDFEHTKEVDAMVQDMVDRELRDVPVKQEPSDRQPSLEGSWGDIEEIEAIDGPTPPAVAARGKSRTRRTRRQKARPAIESGDEVRHISTHAGGVMQPPQGDETHGLSMENEGKQDRHRASRSQHVGREARQQQKGKEKGKGGGKGKATRVIESEGDVCLGFIVMGVLMERSVCSLQGGGGMVHLVWLLMAWWKKRSAQPTACGHSCPLTLSRLWTPARSTPPCPLSCQRGRG